VEDGRGGSLVDRAGRMEDMWPLVFNTVPLERSSIIQAFTPGFLDSRCKVSSIESALAACFNAL
jgi:hypothetical protein